MAQIADTKRPRGNAPPERPRVAVLIPCLNEERMVASVVRDFKRELPDAEIWVVDNGSADSTPEVARAAGAQIIREPRTGKGFALRLALRDIDADVYVLADGDGQLPAESVHELMRPVLEGRADMVVGSRALAGRTSPRFVNNLGNLLFSKLLRLLLGVRVTDVLSGYRALSRVLVRSLPLAARNFEIEVEMTIKTSQRSYRISEVPYVVRPRPEDSRPHLRVFRDGAVIAWTILLLFRDYRPMAFFGLLGAASFAMAWLFVGFPGGATQSTEVFSNPPAVLFVMAGMLLLTVGLTVSVLARRLGELESKIDMVTTGVVGRRDVEN